MRQAVKMEKDKDLHEWRKRAKLLGYHLDLFRNHLRKKGKRLRREAKELGELLGKDHDLAVFQAAVGNSPALSSARRGDLLHRAERCRRQLLQQAASIGRHPSAFRQTRLLCR
jgi:CHAD domain-containing protein